MTNLISISLENEMDLILAHKKSMRIAEKLGLTVATQTTFATAVSEIARSVIEHTDNGNLEVGIEQQKLRFGLKAKISFDKDIRLTNEDEGFYYAHKLVPELNFIEGDIENLVEMKIGLPRSLRLDPSKIILLREFFANEPPLNAYEEIKQRNQSLNRLAGEREEELRQSKLIDEKKNEFIAMASHEIKTPITVIKAYIQMLNLSKSECSDQVRSFVQKIDYQVSKLVMLVQQLLDVSKIENGHLVYELDEILLNPYIHDMVAVMRNIIPKHEISVVYCDPVGVRIDKLRMEQVFTNLLGNAAKYSEENTVIRISCHKIDDQFVRIDVSDEGIGLSETSMQSVFDKFYRDKDVMVSHSGLGMGLYIASKIITGHGGKIWVDSEEGVGSTFSFTLPYINNL